MGKMMVDNRLDRVGPVLSEGCWMADGKDVRQAKAKGQLFASEGALKNVHRRVAVLGQLN